MNFSLPRAFVPAVLLGEAEPKANEQSAKPAENLAVISLACNFSLKLQNFFRCFIIVSLLFHFSHVCSYLNLSSFSFSLCALDCRTCFFGHNLKLVKHKLGFK